MLPFLVIFTFRGCELLWPLRGASVTRQWLSPKIEMRVLIASSIFVADPMYLWIRFKIYVWKGLTFYFFRIQDTDAYFEKSGGCVNKGLFRKRSNSQNLSSGPELP